MNKKKDFQDFFVRQDKSAGRDVAQHIQDIVHKDMNSSPVSIYTKLTFIQGFVAFITLLFCPQFGHSLTHNHQVYHFFHQNFGTYGCQVACALLFIGTGAIIAGLILKPHELYALGHKKLPYYFALSLISVMVFLFLGTELYLELVLVWFFTAVLGGTLLFKLGRLIRLRGHDYPIRSA